MNSKGESFLSLLDPRGLKAVPGLWLHPSCPCLHFHRAFSPVFPQIFPCFLLWKQQLLDLWPPTYVSAWESWVNYLQVILFLKSHVLTFWVDLNLGSRTHTHTFQHCTHLATHTQVLVSCLLITLIGCSSALFRTCSLELSWVHWYLCAKASIFPHTNGNPYFWKLLPNDPLTFHWTASPTAPWSGRLYCSPYFFSLNSVLLETQRAKAAFVLLCSPLSTYVYVLFSDFQSFLDLSVFSIA